MGETSSKLQRQTSTGFLVVDLESPGSETAEEPVPEPEPVPTPPPPTIAEQWESLFSKSDYFEILKAKV